MRYRCFLFFLASLELDAKGEGEGGKVVRWIRAAVTAARLSCCFFAFVAFFAFSARLFCLSMFLFADFLGFPRQ